MHPRFINSLIRHCFTRISQYFTELPVLRSAKRVPANDRPLNNSSDVIFYCSVGKRSRALALLNAAQESSSYSTMAKTGEDRTFWPWFVMMTFHSANSVCSTSFQVKCWLGPASCGLCCRCLPQINESTGTRFMYTLFLVIGFVVASLMLSPQLEQTFIDNVSTMFLLVLFTATCVMNTFTILFCHTFF